MGYIINIKGVFDGLNGKQIRDYVETVVAEAEGKSPQRVIFHSATGQSPDEKMRQLRALQSSPNK